MPVTFHPHGKSTPATGNPDAPPAALSQEKAQFFEALKSQEPAAIRRLAKRVGDYLASISASSRLMPEDREEMVNDAVFITLQKISGGQFELQNADPSTYAIAVARNLTGNFLQKKRLETTHLDRLENQPSLDFDPEKYFQRKEREAQLDSLLERLGEPCRQLILLRYYEEISDEEAIAQKRTAYSNTDSLKVQRCKCLKKLAEMVRKRRELFS